MVHHGATPRGTERLQFELRRDGASVLMTRAEAKAYGVDLIERRRKADETALLRRVHLGVYLMEVKRQVPHGEWLQWLDGISLHQRVAQEAMQAATNYADGFGELDRAKLFELVHAVFPERYPSLDTFDRTRVSIREEKKARARLLAASRGESAAATPQLRTEKPDICERIDSGLGGTHNALLDDADEGYDDEDSDDSMIWSDDIDAGSVSLCLRGESVSDADGDDEAWGDVTAVPSGGVVATLVADAPQQLLLDELYAEVEARLAFLRARLDSRTLGNADLLRRAMLALDEILNTNTPGTTQR